MNFVNENKKKYDISYKDYCTNKLFNGNELQAYPAIQRAVIGHSGCNCHGKITGFTIDTILEQCMDRDETMRTAKFLKQLYDNNQSINDYVKQSRKSVRNISAEAAFEKYCGKELFIAEAMEEEDDEEELKRREKRKVIKSQKSVEGKTNKHVIKFPKVKRGVVETILSVHGCNSFDPASDGPQVVSVRDNQFDNCVEALEGSAGWRPSRGVNQEEWEQRYLELRRFDM